MNADFESQLQRRPLRELPRDWRAEILAAAGSAHVNGRAALPRRPELGRSSTFAQVGRDSVEPILDLPGNSHGSIPMYRDPTVMGNPQSAIRNPQSSHGSIPMYRDPTLAAFPGERVSTWPSLRPWAALAAAWVVIFLLHFTAPDEPQIARNSPRMTLQSFAMLHEQTLIMAQLLGEPDQADAVEPRAALPAPPKPRSEIARKQLVG